MDAPGVSALRASLQETLPEEVTRLLTNGSALRRPPGAHLAEAPPSRFGAPPVDQSRFPLPLPRGLPRGTLVEVVGWRSSGRFALALAALAAATQMGESAALVDLGDHLDPQGAAAEGVELSRVLWVRRGTLKEALGSAELVLGAGFSLVVLDLGLPGLKRRNERAHELACRTSRVRLEAAWVRLARRAKAHDAALLVLTPYRASGTAAGTGLTARAARALWATSKTDERDIASSRDRPVLAGLETRLVLEKERGGAPGALNRVTLTTPSLIAGLELPGAAQRPSLLERKVRHA